MSWFINSSSIDFGLALDFELTIDKSIRDLFDVQGFRQQLDAEVLRAASQLRNFWESEAGRTLRSSRHRYIAAIEDPQYDVSTGAVSIVLNDEFAAMVERGSSQPPWDLKPQFLKGAKPIKNPSRSKSGASMYRIIPLNVNREPVPRVGLAWYSNPQFRVLTDVSTGWIWTSQRQPYAIVTEVQKEGERLLTEAVARALEAL